MSTSVYNNMKVHKHDQTFTIHTRTYSNSKQLSSSVHSKEERALPYAKAHKQYKRCADVRKYVPYA